MTPYGDIDLGKHLLAQLFVTEQHESITWSYVDLASQVLCDMQPRAISQGVFKNL